MGKRFAISVISICIFCLLCGMLSGFTDALSTSETLEITFDEPETIDFNELVSVPVYVDGILADSGYLIGARTYTRLDVMLRTLGIEMEYEWAEDNSSLKGTTDGLSLTVYVDEGYIEANGRCLFCEEGVYVYEDSALIPVRELARALGLQTVWDEDGESVNLDTETLAYISSGDEFYNEEDLYWLARIINAESNGQPIDGQIAVGNVVLNRVQHPSCPDTVYDVIFDTRYGVQFSPIESGGIYIEPSETAIASAKMSLEGYSTAGDSLYFVNPETGATKWFRSTRTFVASIGNHDFYS